MLNYTDTATITGRVVSGTDPDTGQPVHGDVTYLSDAPCDFSVLNAAAQVQSWGEDDTVTQLVTGSLILPAWSPAITDTTTASVEVAGYAGSWRILSARPGSEWTTYLLARN